MHALNKMVKYAMTQKGVYNDTFEISSYITDFDNSKIFEPESNTVYNFQTFSFSSEEHGDNGNIVYKTGIKKDEINIEHIIDYNSNVYLLPEVFFETQLGQKNYGESLNMSEFVDKAKDKLNAGEKLYHFECSWRRRDLDDVTISQTVYIDGESVKRLHNDEVVDNIIDINKLEFVIVKKFKNSVATFVQFVKSYFKT